jgi:hypothetical protein
MLILSRICIQKSAPSASQG